MIKLVLLFAMGLNPYHPPIDPCHYHPCHAEIPEPATVVLVGVGLAVAIGYGMVKRGKKEE